MDTSKPHGAFFLSGTWITDFVNVIYKYNSVNYIQLKLISENCRFEFEDEEPSEYCFTPVKQTHSFNISHMGR